MTCRDAIDVLADYLDGTMPAELAAELERHLADCAACRAYLATYRKARELGAAAGRVEVPPEMRERLRRFLAAQLRGSD
jgi:anti-sigma factor (TIGR02949 family)